MSVNIRVVAAHDGTVQNRDVRFALNDLSDSAVSVSSPLSAGGDEVGIIMRDDAVELVVGGYDGEFTKTSQQALTDTLRTVEGVDAETVAVTEGGYEPPSDDDGEEE